MEQVTMTINESIADQIAEKIIKRVKNTPKRKTAKKDSKVQTFYFVAHYNYTTDQYKWSASLRYAVQNLDDAEELAHNAIQARHGKERPYQLMYTRQET